MFIPHSGNLRLPTATQITHLGCQINCTSGRAVRTYAWITARDDAEDGVRRTMISWDAGSSHCKSDPFLTAAVAGCVLSNRAFKNSSWHRHGHHLFSLAVTAVSALPRPDACSQLLAAAAALAHDQPRHTVYQGTPWRLTSSCSQAVGWGGDVNNTAWDMVSSLLQCFSPSRGKHGKISPLNKNYLK